MDGQDGEDVWLRLLLSCSSCVSMLVSLVWEFAWMDGMEGMFG